jgi:hypothetical protein
MLAPSLIHLVRAFRKSLSQAFQYDLRDGVLARVREGKMR